MGRFSDALQGSGPAPRRTVLIRPLGAVSTGAAGVTAVTVSPRAGEPLMPARWTAAFARTVAAGLPAGGVEVLVMIVDGQPIVVDVVGG